jgi:hypothetical protein
VHVDLVLASLAFAPLASVMPASCQVWAPPPVGTVVDVEWLPPHGTCRGRVVTTDKSCAVVQYDGDDAPYPEPLNFADGEVRKIVTIVGAKEPQARRQDRRTKAEKAHGVALPKRSKKVTRVADTVEQPPDTNTTVATRVKPEPMPATRKDRRTKAEKAAGVTQPRRRRKKPNPVGPAQPQPCPPTPDSGWLEVGIVRPPSGRLVGGNIVREDETAGAEEQPQAQPPPAYSPRTLARRELTRMSSANSDPIFVHHSHGQPPEVPAAGQQCTQAKPVRTLSHLNIMRRKEELEQQERRLQQAELKVEVRAHAVLCGSIRSYGHCNCWHGYLSDGVATGLATVKERAE